MSAADMAFDASNLVPLVTDGIEDERGVCVGTSGSNGRCHLADRSPVRRFTTVAATWRTSFDEHPACGGDVVAQRIFGAIAGP